MRLRRYLAGTALAASHAGGASAHPFDGLTADEYRKINAKGASAVIAERLAAVRNG
jgi:hypothetical protein